MINSAARPVVLRSITAGAAIGRWAFAIALVAILATGCSGKKKSDDAGASGGLSGANFTARKLADVDSYKYKMKMEGTGGPLTLYAAGLPASDTPAAAQNVVVDISGAYVKPDKAQLSVAVGALAATQTIIGDQQWTTFGQISQGPSKVSAQSARDLSLVAQFWDQSTLGDNMGSFNCPKSRETINGVSTQKCVLDRAGFDRIRGQLAGFLEGSAIKELSKFQLELWLVADDGYPVRLSIDMAGKDQDDKDFVLKIGMDVTDVNGNVEIRAPS